MKQTLLNELTEILGVPIDTCDVVSADGAVIGISGYWEPIVDRTLADCIYGNQKGSLDYITLNRLEANLCYIVARLHKMGYSCKVEEFTKVWSKTDYIFVADYNRIATNYNKLAFFLAEDFLPLHSEGDYLPYEEVNILETFCLSVLSDIKCILDSTYCCNEIFCGED